MVKLSLVKCYSRYRVIKDKYHPGGWEVEAVMPTFLQAVRNFKSRQIDLYVDKDSFVGKDAVIFSSLDSTR